MNRPARTHTKENRTGENIRSRIITVFSLFLFFVDVLLFLVHRLEFDGIDGRNLEVHATLRAGEDFSFIDLIFFHVETGFALRTVEHNASVPRARDYDCSLLYLVSSTAEVKWASPRHSGPRNVLSGCRCTQE